MATYCISLACQQDFKPFNPWFIVQGWNSNCAGLIYILHRSPVWQHVAHSPFKLLRWWDTQQGKAADIAWESHRDYNEQFGRGVKYVALALTRGTEKSNTNLNKVKMLKPLLLWQNNSQQITSIFILNINHYLGICKFLNL